MENCSGVNWTTDFKLWSFFWSKYPNFPRLSWCTVSRDTELLLEQWRLYESFQPQSESPELSDAQKHSKSYREASWKLPRGFDKKAEISKKKHFCRSNENLSVIRTFAQGTDWEQRRHFWIAFAMVLNGKLLQTQTNSQILSYDHFLVKIHKIFQAPFEVNCPCHRITLRAAKALQVT